MYLKPYPKLSQGYRQLLIVAHIFDQLNYYYAVIIRYKYPILLLYHKMLIIN